MVQDGEDDLVHVLPQPEVDLLLLLEGFHELMVMGEAVRGRPRRSQVPGLTGSPCPRTELRRPRQGSPKTNQPQHSVPGHESKARLNSHPGRVNYADAQAHPQRP